MVGPTHRFRVVDVHGRLTAAGGRTRGPEVTAEDVEREHREAGIVRGVVFPGRAAPEFLTRANNATARAAVDRPLVAFARLTGPRDPGGSPGSRLRSLAGGRGDHPGPEDVEQYAYDDRFHGFRLDPARDGLPDRDTLAVLADVGRPVSVRGGAGFPPEDAVDLARRGFPVLLSGFGGQRLGREQMHEAVDALDRVDDLYLDTAGVHYRDVLARAVQEHPGRVLFGSGLPDVHPSVAVTELLALDVSGDSTERVLEGNAARLLDALAQES